VFTKLARDHLISLVYSGPGQPGELGIQDNVRVTADMVSDIDRGCNTEDATVMIINQGKKDLSQKFRGAFGVDYSVGDVADTGFVGVKLWGYTLDVGEGFEGIRDGVLDSAPPFVGYGAGGEGDDVPVGPVVAFLREGLVRRKEEGGGERIRFWRRRRRGRTWL
jgi:hypothetical protein